MLVSRLGNGSAISGAMFFRASHATGILAVLFPMGVVLVRSWAWLMAVGVGVACCSAMDSSAAQTYPQVSVYAHRGASALLPEHTLAAYAQAISDGADYIEPDLVMSKDGVMLARHENEIGSTTDVASRPEFASRRTRKLIDGQQVEGWFSEDFTIAELKTLYARERLPQIRGTAFDGQFRIATLDEIISFLVQQAARANRGIGLAPEIKHGSYFKGIGLPMEDKLLGSLQGNNYTKVAPVLLQSFETANLRQIRGKLGKDSNIRLLQLLGSSDEKPADVALAGGSLTYAQMMTPTGLRDIAGYADAIGVERRVLVPLDAQGRLAAPTALIGDAHAAGLQVVAYSFRPENPFLPPALRERTQPGSFGPGNTQLPAGRHRCLLYR